MTFAIKIRTSEDVRGSKYVKFCFYLIFATLMSVVTQLIFHPGWCMVFGNTKKSSFHFYRKTTTTEKPTTTTTPTTTTKKTTTTTTEKT